MSHDQGRGHAVWAPTGEGYACIPTSHIIGVDRTPRPALDQRTAQGRAVRSFPSYPRQELVGETTPGALPRERRGEQSTRPHDQDRARGGPTDAAPAVWNRCGSARLRHRTHRGHGCVGGHVNGRVEEAIGAAMAYPGPAIIEFRVARTEDVYPEGIAPADCRLSHTRPVWRLENGRAVVYTKQSEQAHVSLGVHSLPLDHPDRSHPCARYGNRPRAATVRPLTKMLAEPQRRGQNSCGDAIVPILTRLPLLGFFRVAPVFALCFAVSPGFAQSVGLPKSSSASASPTVAEPPRSQGGLPHAPSGPLDETATRSAAARARMLECGHQWSAMKKAGTASGTWRDFSKVCLARK